MRVILTLFHCRAGHVRMPVVHEVVAGYVPAPHCKKPAQCVKPIDYITIILFPLPFVAQRQGYSFLSAGID